MQRNSSPGRPRASAAHAKSRVGSNVKISVGVSTALAMAVGSFLVAGPATAISELHSDRFTYTITGNSPHKVATITDYDSALKDNTRYGNGYDSDATRKSPTVDLTIDGLETIKIAANAFKNEDLTAVTIGSKVTEIGASAFAENDLTTATIGSSVTSIGASAFAGESRYGNLLTTISIPNTVTTIGANAFESNSLATVTLGTGVTSIGASAFYQNLLTTVVVPAAVTTIGASAFKDNKLTTVTLGTGVTSIGSTAFGDNKLTAVVLPASVVNFGSEIFDDNEDLATVEFLGNSPVFSGHNATFEAADDNDGSLVSEDDDIWDDLKVIFNTTKTGFTISGSGSNARWAGYKFKKVTPPTLSTTLPLAAATYGEVYTPVTLAGAGLDYSGLTAVTYAVTGLPTGMSATAGVISGTPTWSSEAPSTYQVTIVTSNGVSVAATNTFTFTVNPRLLKFTNTELPAGQEGVSYSAEFTITGDEDIDLLDKDDNLAGLGLSLDREGNTVSIEGTPDRDTAGTDLHFTITASNNLTGDVDHEFTITIAAAVPLTFTPITLPEGQAGQAYPSQQFAAATGTAPVTFSSTTDLEALGLALSEDGELTGTPTTAGETSIEVTISNGYADDATETFTFTVIPVTIAELALNFVAGSNADDATVSFEAEGLEEDSAYTLTLHSDPFILSQGFVTHNGILTITASIPANTPAGAHSVVLSAIGYDGKPVTRTAWFSILADGTIGGISYTEEVGYELLSTTGTNPAVPLGAAILMLLAGGLLVLRRRTSTI
jgi:hypothetical protein